jgi:hypothetical protein
MNKYNTHLIALLAVCMIVFSQASYFWENTPIFTVIDNIFDYLFLLLHGIVILILASEGRQKKSAFILVLIEVTFLIASLLYLI